MKKSLGESPWIVGLYIAYQDDNERAKDALQYGISLDQWSYKTEISKELTKNIRGTIGYAYKDIHYNEYDALFNLKRKDNENYYVLGLSYAIDKQSSIILQYAYTDHNSNNALYAYTKNLTSLSYMRSF
jgi:predicted porin